MKDLNYYMSLNYKQDIVKVNDPDGVYVQASIPRLPGVIAFGNTTSEALKDLEGAKEIWLKKCLSEGIAIPEPITETFSGRITLRMPKSLHKELSDFAEDEGTSLNQYIVTLLEQNNVLSVGSWLMNQFAKYIPLGSFSKDSSTDYRIKINADQQGQSSDIDSPISISSDQTVRVEGVVIEEN